MIEAMFDVPFDTLLIASLILIFAGVVRGFVGFGLILTASPALFLLFPPKFVIAVLIVPSLLGDLTILWKEGVAWSFLRTQRYLFVATVLGTTVGVLGLSVVQNGVILALVSVYIFLYLAFETRSDVVEAWAAKSGSGVVIGSIAGLLGGTTGMSGPPIVTYVHARNLQKRNLISALALFFMTIAIVRIPSMYFIGLFGVPELAFSLVFIVPIFLGVYAGSIARSHISQVKFEWLIRGVLLAIAIKLLSDSGAWSLVTGVG